MPNPGTARSPTLRRIRTAVLWAAPVWLCLAYLTFPELRPGLRAFLGLGYLLVLWFFLARTKTLSWQSLAGLFALGLPWAVAIAAVGRAASDRLAVDDLGARTALAAVAEPSLTLLPLLLLVVLAPTRVRGFSVTDWLLAGLVTGCAVQAVEELTRLDGSHAGYGPGPFGGGAAALPEAGFAGRPVLMALLGVTIGLAVAAWRHGGKQALSPAARAAWRVLAVLAPPACWWLVVSVHLGWNAILAAGDRWTGVADSSVPWILRVGWTLGGHGFGAGWVLLLLFLVALLVDAGRLRNAAEEADDPLPYPFAPTHRGDQWAGRLTRWAGTRSSLPVAAAVWLLATGCAVLAYAVRDLVVVLAGFARQGDRKGKRKAPRESRWTAIGRGSAAGVLVRTIRADAIALAAGPDTPVTRRVTRVIGLAGVLGLLLAVFWLGPLWAARLGDRVGAGDAAAGASAGGAPEAWLAGSAAALSPWWNQLGVWQHAVLVLGFLALMAFSAGPLDPGVAGGRSVWLAVRAPSGFRPVDLVRSYLSRSSPAEAAVDAVGALLGLVPGGRAGSTTGQVQAAVQQFITAPAAFIPDRRAALAAARRSADPVGASTVRPVAARPEGGLPALKLADGRLLAALSEDEERLFVATLDDLARDHSTAAEPVRGDGRDPSPAAEYRARIYGDEERLIFLRPEKWSDGQNTAYGMVADTAYYDGRGVSWYLPDTLPEPIRHKANLEMDRRLIEFATVVYYPANPFRALEVTTNHPLVAQVLEERMSRLAIPGYVVLEP